ncbi:MAG TPA: UDP-N-acetylglucosamine-1-phosphate transferase [Nitrososphaera sp.]|jgi:UDP-N-acetylglucosamine--dolichyl-phosphate N-acetylglucosaminephosphotransferase|nr:UDP-N-acetylglucosamine-1-phosphate transferase [Nitrososphaera sp.]
MLDIVNLLIYGAVVSAISFFVIILLLPAAIRSLTAKGRLVPDAHKRDKPMIPRPAGPVIMAGIAAAEIVLYVLTMNIAVLAVLLSTAIAFAVGYVDDNRVMPGWFKPVALLAAAVPLVSLDLYIGGVHEDSLNLVFGRALIPLLYIPLIFVIIPITGNTINSIDVLNGVASGFIIIAMIPLLASIAIFGSHEVFLAALPLLFAVVAFYKYHKFPSRIFPGDSGTLLFGAMYGALAVAGSSEIIGVIALLPAVMNSFLFLASVRRIVEHRQIKARPTILMDDFKLAASKDKTAPATLVRLIVADGPLDEKAVGFQIFKLATFTALLAFVSIAIQYAILRS